MGIPPCYALSWQEREIDFSVETQNFRTCFSRDFRDIKNFKQYLTSDFDDGTDADIEEYLKAEFSRIATEQKLSETWPGQQVIQDFVHRSSGYFVYAETIIKLIGEGSDAEIQLDLIRNLQPRTTSPFAHLDELYLAILEGQPDQVFLKNVLALLVVHSSTLEGYEHLAIDDAVLMNVSWRVLQAKLWHMHSLLQLEPYIDVHDYSFLGFLQEASRSGQYHTSKEEASRQFLKLIIGSLVRHVIKVLNQPEYHGVEHFALRFSRVITEYPLRIELPLAEWQEVLQPLLRLGRKIFIPCTKRTVVRIIRDLLLHLAFLRGISSIRSSELIVDEVKELDGYLDDAVVIDDSLQSCLSLLLARLRDPRRRPDLINTEIMAQICTVLYFDCAEIVARIHSILDAQNLVDLMVCLLDERDFLNQCGPGIERKAIFLVLEIYARIPVLPRSLFLEGNAYSGLEKWHCRHSEIEVLCQSALITKILDNEYIVPVSRVCEEEGKFTFVGRNENERRVSLSRWRTRGNPSSEAIIQVMWKVAKAFQYLHSMGIVLHYDTYSDDIFLDSNLSVKIMFFGSFLLYIIKTHSVCLEERSKVLMTRETNVFKFGCLFYQMAFNIKILHEDQVQFKRDIIAQRPTKSEIPDEVWELIQRCCREDPKRRPTMDEIVVEMERWNLPPFSDPQKHVAKIRTDRKKDVNDNNIYIL